MKNFIKYGVPLLTVIVIAVVGYFLFIKSDNSSTAKSASTAVSSQGCPVKFQPTVKAYDQYPSMCIDKNKTYTAVIHSSKGDITMDLLAKNAPKTVNNFVFLAKSGFYNNITFHRVIPGFVVQAGDPKGDGTGGPGYTFGDEINAQSLNINQDEIKSNEASGYSYDTSLNTIKITNGVVAMANSGPNTNGSQFFIALAGQPTLDGRYTPFAEVTSGMDIANAIAAVPRDANDKPNDAITISSIDISEK